nr:BlaI/MecI/CopY family transcriptional regulator [uncultured Sulfurimonas sp.]
MTEREFGRIQLRIMQYLWSNQRATAREITDALNEFEPINHKNVQTIIRRLEKKGVISHDIDDRTHIYYPVIKNDNAKLHEVRTFVDKVFHGSLGSLVSSLIESKQMSLDELKKIFKMVDKKE